jgi:endonuclease/exonuclease/phosphatase family metal-dependent hydrolase
MTSRSGGTLPLGITTWNVLNSGYEVADRYHAAAHPFLSWQTQGRADRACRHIVSLASDIYCLQEVNQAMAAHIHTALGGANKYHLIWAPRTPKDARVEDGCAVLYRVDDGIELQSHFVWHYNSTGKHIFLACHFLCDSVPLWVVNTHVNWETRDADLMALQYQLNHHQNFIGECAKVVVGDFNAERSEPWYRALSDNHLVDALLNHRDDWPYSYNSGLLAKWVDYVLLHHLSAETLDHICLGDCWTSVPQFNHTALPSAEVPSDHLSLTVTLTL